METLRNIRRLSSYFCNEDSEGEARAAEALEAGRPAFWSKTTAESGMSLWRDHVNVAGSIAAGIEYVKREFPHSPISANLKQFLAKLIPLNAAAVDDLDNALETMTQTFELKAELRKRNRIFADTNALTGDERARVHVEAGADLPAADALHDPSTERAMERL